MRDVFIVVRFQYFSVMIMEETPELGKYKFASIASAGTRIISSD